MVYKEILSAPVNIYRTSNPVKLWKSGSVPELKAVYPKFLLNYWYLTWKVIAATLVAILFWYKQISLLAPDILELLVCIAV